MLDLPLYILAGGRSSRFGSDKARAVSHGRPLVVGVAEALASRVSGVTVVADVAGKYADLGLRTIADALPARGPLGGLATAIAHRAQRGEGWLLLASCDLLAPRVAWVDALAAAAAPPFRIVAFEGERLEPLFALYHTSLAADLTGALARGDSAVWRFARGAGPRVLQLPDGLRRLPQANTPGELPPPPDQG